MGIITSLVERRATIQGPLPLTAEAILAWVSGPITGSGVRVSNEGALKLVPVWACVRIISEDLASLPLITYGRMERGKQRALGHPLYRLLHNAPNPFMTSMQLRETHQAHLLTWGNAYSNIERDPISGRPVALWPLRPDRMEQPVLSEAGSLLYTYNTPTGEPRALAQNDVLHIRGLAPDGLVGYSPIAMHRENLGWNMATREYGSRFFGNNSQPGGLLQAKQRLSDDAIKKLKGSWEAAHQGLTQAHRVAVLEEGIEWKQTGIPPEDAQYIETMNFQLDDVARIFRVPPHKIANLLRATYSNIEDQSISYVVDTLRPWAVRWEQQINKDLVMPRERDLIFVEHLMDALLRGKTLERFQAYQIGLQNGIFSANDVRERENMNPFEGGDVYLQPMNMAPYGSMPEPKAEPTRMRELRRIEGGYQLLEREAADG